MEDFIYHVRHRAYELWEAAGRPDNKHLDFWEAAERELRARGDSAAPEAVAGAPHAASSHAAEK